VIVGTDPAAGGEILETVPAGAQWRLIAMRATLVTDVTVINRVVRLASDDGASSFVQIDVAYAQPQSTGIVYTFADFSLRGIGAVDTVVCGFPGRAILGAGFRFRTATFNLQAGDNWSAPVYMVEEWPV
jgi:hypothetical protein